jgi:Tfp pilus assembly protein PilO
MSNSTPSLWRERLASPLTWHYATFALLLIAVIGLSIRFGLDWAATSGSSADALAAKEVQLKAKELQTAPLRGLDKRVEDTRAQVQAFYAKRIPPNYSSIDRRIGELALKGPVRLSRVQYSQGAPGSDLTEISLDAGITGNYQQIMRFVNSLERDQTFFVIRGLSLTGQQGGLVNLRLKVSTWLRPGDAAARRLPLRERRADSHGPAPGNRKQAPGLYTRRAIGGDCLRRRLRAEGKFWRLLDAGTAGGGSTVHCRSACFGARPHGYRKSFLIRLAGSSEAFQRRH